jgi:predicted DNA-binding WGR domain protein
MMETILILKEGFSNKFWKIKVAGKSHTVTYGKIGTVGAVKVKTFETEEACQKNADRLVRSKMKKGYVPANPSDQFMKESTMTDHLFWEIIKIAKQKGEDADEQIEWLINHLSKKPVKEIVMFDYYFNQNYMKSYTSALWATAYIIMGGASDDSFDYFRAWLLYQGKETYETVIHDPEKIIPHLKVLEDDEDVPQLEDLLSVASIAYEERTGLDYDDYYELYEKITEDQNPMPDIEFDWDEDDEEGLKKKFPALWARYGESPLEY